MCRLSPSSPATLTECVYRRGEEKEESCCCSFNCVHDYGTAAAAAEAASADQITATDFSAGDLCAPSLSPPLSYLSRPRWLQRRRRRRRHESVFARSRGRGRRQEEHEERRVSLLSSSSSFVGEGEGEGEGTRSHVSPSTLCVTACPIPAPETLPRHKSWSLYLSRAAHLSSLSFSRSCTSSGANSTAGGEAVQLSVSVVSHVLLPGSTS